MRPAALLLIALVLPADAPSSADDAIARGRDWWSFQPVRRPGVPTVPGVAHPIDAFVRKAQAEVDVSPSPEADRLTLVRRLMFDLTGLPPSPAEVEAFVDDRGPMAYERLVDRLLASPAFGERWARPWLDLARYADSAGFEFDKVRPDAWRYRDWVVKSLNEDMPYDRFVRLQLAADEAAPEAPEHLPALGFLRNGPEVGNQKNEAIRADELDDIVGTTAGALLGLTVQCARCHDHKFDPVPTEDYYRLAAVFAPGEFADLPLVRRDEAARHRAESSRADARIDALRAEVLKIDRAARRQLKDGNQATAEQVAESLDAVERAARDEWQARVAHAESQRPAPLPESLGVVERPDRVKPVHVLIRGDVASKGAEVRPGPPRAVAGEVIDFADAPEGSTSTGRRSALADWVVDPNNPLTARVAVNRLWQGHFGTGLVATPSDFGAMGEAPAMPELLDWLAAEFIASGWSRKAIHRLIVTSATYRQSSRSRPEMKELDPDCSMLWRFPPRRLDAEMIRDAVLWCAGSLNEARGGPGVFPPIDPAVVRTGNVPRWPLDARDGPDVWRRSLYLFQMRTVVIPLLEVFDLPDSTQSCPQRSRTTIPTQSLSLLNNPFLLDQSRRFAERVAREAGPGTNDRAELAHRLATGRPLSEVRREAIVSFLARQTAWHVEHATDSAELTALADLCHVLYNSNGFLYLD